MATRQLATSDGKAFNFAGGEGWQFDIKALEAAYGWTPNIGDVYSIIVDTSQYKYIQIGLIIDTAAANVLVLRTYDPVAVSSGPLLHLASNTNAGCSINSSVTGATLTGYVRTPLTQASITLAAVPSSFIMSVNLFGRV